MSSFVRRQFVEAIDYIKECKSYIYFAISIFFISIVFGFIFASHLGFLDETLAKLADMTRGLNLPQLIFFIMQNNVQAALTALILGIFFGIVPLINAITNGIVLGYVSNLVSGSFGILSLWKILPHGIFELPAIFISVGLGLRLGSSVLFRKKLNFMEKLYSSINVFLFVVLPLLIIAALIEGILIFIIK